MDESDFIIEETFLSSTEEERRQNLQRLMEQYLRDLLRREEQP